jgi:hypothetical protein
MEAQEELETEKQKLKLMDSDLKEHETSNKN